MYTVVKMQNKYQYKTYAQQFTKAKNTIDQYGMILLFDLLHDCDIALCYYIEQPIKTVCHILMECNQQLRQQQRQLMLDQLVQYDSDYSNNPYKDNVQYLLFPHLKYKKCDCNKMDNILIRTQIIRSVLFYCRYQFPD